MLLALLAFCNARSASADEEFAAAHRAILDRRTAAYTKLWTWCKSRKLLLETERIARRLVELQPKEKRWRKWLGHKQDENGEWNPDPGRKPRKNWKPKALSLLPQKRREIFEPLSSDLRRLVSASGQELPVWQRNLAYADLVEFNPDDEDARAGNGEVRKGDKWILRESRDAAGNEEKLLDRLRAIRGKVPPREPCPPTAEDNKFGIRWTSSARVGPYRVMTTGVGAAGDIASSCWVMREFVGQMFEVAAERVPGMTIYLVREYKDWKQLLARSGLSQQDRAAYARLSGFWFPDRRRTAGIERTDAGAIDSSVRNVETLATNVLRPNTYRMHGLNQGIGLYLTYLVTGTRLTTYITRTRYKEPEGGRGASIRDADANWLKLARDLQDRGHLPSLMSLLGTPLNAMTQEDLICSYALARYIYNGHLNDAVRFLRAVDKTKQFDLAARTVLGHDLGGINRRLVRWIQEMTVPE